MRVESDLDGLIKRK
jgi:hypothetical protein